MWTSLFHAQPVPQTALMKCMLTTQYQTVIMAGLLKTNPTMGVSLSFDLPFLGEVNEQQSRKDLGEDLFYQVVTPQEGIGDSYQYEIKTAQVEDE